MHHKREVGMALRMIRAYDPHVERSYVERLIDRAAHLGPCQGEDDTMWARMQFLREQDAKAKGH